MKKTYFTLKMIVKIFETDNVIRTSPDIPTDDNELPPVWID